MTENVEKELDLTNGTRGEVVDIVLDPLMNGIPVDKRVIGIFN